MRNLTLLIVPRTWEISRLEEIVMANNKVRRNRETHSGLPSIENLSQPFQLEPLALPDDEIRRLVALTTTRYKIEPFARQLIRLMDELKAGQNNNIAKLMRPGRDESRRILFAAIANTVKGGQEMAAYHTAFRAGLYAYENSLDHLLAFMDYSDRLRQQTDDSAQAS
jgi:hypothetical protein